MRIVRPEPHLLPVTYADDGTVLSDPNDPAREGTGGPEGTESVATTAPPLSGRGSGIEAWRTYARDLGLAVDDEMPKAEIVAQLRSIGAIPPGDAPGEDEEA